MDIIQERKCFYTFYTESASKNCILKIKPDLYLTICGYYAGRKTLRIQFWIFYRKLKIVSSQKGSAVKTDALQINGDRRDYDKCIVIV